MFYPKKKQNCYETNKNKVEKIKKNEQVFDFIAKNCKLNSPKQVILIKMNRSANFPKQNERKKERERKEAEERSI